MSKKKNKTQGEMPPLPEGFINEMESILGAEETRSLVSALDEKPSVSIRVNRRKVEDPADFMKRFEAFSPAPVPWCESGFYLESRPDFIHDPLLHAGTYYVQEAASMVYESIAADYLSSLTSVPSHLNILDLCAAPGGKTTAILNALAVSELGADGPSPINYTLVANEFDSRRAGILKENLDKWGDPSVIITNSHTVKFSRLENSFDIVAVDAPCSGEGMMRREPVARSQWSENLVAQCAGLQRDILQDAVVTLKPGGLLIYSTCTFNRRENEENAAWIEEKFGLLLFMTPRHFYPHRQRCEGLFVSAFIKPGEGSECRRNILESLKKAGVRIIGAGTEKTLSKGNMEIPSSRQVLAYDYDRNLFPIVDLDLEQAIAYLRRNSLSLPPEVPEGYVAVYCLGYPLGLVKNLRNRANNLYPAEWRILT